MKPLSLIKRLVPKSFARKLGQTFLVTVLVLTALQYYLFYTSWRSYVDEGEQIPHWNLAEILAEEFEPHLRQGKVTPELKLAFVRATMINPRISIYLLDTQGKFIEHSLTQTDPVTGLPYGYSILDPSTIERFFDTPEERSLPLYGVDPKWGFTGRRRIFSAAKVLFGDSPAYLYVVILNAKYSSAMKASGDYYLLISGLIIHIIVAIAALIVGGVLFSIITKRFRQLSAGVSSFSEENLDHRVEISGNDEIADLAGAFNSMAQSLQDSIEHLKESDLARRDLMRNITHDLGAPLTSALGNLDKLSGIESSAVDETSQKRVATVKKNLDYVTRLIDNLGNLARLESRELKPEFELLSLPSLIEESILPNVETSASARSIEVRTLWTLPIPGVYADFGMMERVLANLVENAIRYNKESGTVEIVLEQEGAKVRVSVRDTGVGIAEQEKDKIHSRFYRGDAGSKTGAEGSGVGLAVITEILALHQSSLEISSVVDQGSCFSFLLPTSTQGANAENKDCK